MVGVAGLPSGVVTFLFTDVVGSTRLWEADPAATSLAMARHDELIETAVVAAGGVLVRPRGEGDSRFAVFISPTAALTAAADFSVALAGELWPTSVPIRVRAAVGTGEADVRAGDYYGDVVNRTARLRSVGPTIVGTVGGTPSPCRRPTEPNQGMERGTQEFLGALLRASG